MYDGELKTMPLTGLTDTAETVLKRRYYQPGEDWQKLCLRVAHHIADNEEQKEEFLNMMERLDFLPNSPTLMNAGTEVGQLSACFVLPVEDNLESIFDTVKHAALVNKTGGGTGFSFSKLRPAGAKVGSTNGVASGPLSFAGVIDKATDVIKQGGRRRGANMGVLRVDHPDILTFIQAKEIEGEFANFNFSVALTDAFMNCVNEGTQYDLVDPATGAIVDTLPAKLVWNMIVERAHKNGEPGILFIDKANEANPTPWLGEYEATNPCGEIWLLPYESCNLGSINLSNFVRPYDHAVGGSAVDYERLGEVARLATRFLDNVIDKNVLPIPEIKEASAKTRKIGLGIMGLHDMLIQLGIPYASEEGRRVAADVMKYIKAIATHESIKMAGEKGQYQAGEGNESIIPIRNACLTSIQPTGTVSMIADCASGCEPYFSIVSQKHVMDGDSLVLVNRHFERTAQEEGFYHADLMESVIDIGVVNNPVIPDRWQNVFATAMEISPEDHLAMQAALQPYIDSSISKTINMPNEATVEDVANIYMQAWELGCKGLTIYRDGSREQQVLYMGGASETKQTATVNGSGTVKAGLPDILNAKRFRVSGKDGAKIYIIICFDEQEKPAEVFAKFPFDHRADQASKSTLWTTVCRLISLALRYGVPSNEVVKQLDKSAGSIGDLPSQLAKILKTFQSETKAGYRLTCPECQGQMVYEEGCSKCLSCAWSKCD